MNTYYLNIFRKLIFSTLLVAFICNDLAAQSFSPGQENPQKQLLEVNPPNAPGDNEVTAIIGARLVDGLGGTPVERSVVIVKGNKIAAVGTRDEIEIPAEARRYHANGKTLMPGLIDAHYHSVNDNESLTTILNNGTTTIRDPGHPFRFYQSLYFADNPLPRTYLTGAHLGGFPPVYAQQAVIVKDARHARQTVDEHAANGATAIKTYFNLPEPYYKVVTETASEHGIPVTGHLELVDADKVIEAGIDGIEHITSFGTALADPEESRKFKEALNEDYNNRREWRFKLWASIDLTTERVQKVLDLAAESNIVICPTLAVFERKSSEDDVQDYHVKGYQNMSRFVAMAHQAGISIVTGSHRSVRYAERGWAYQHEMEVLVEAGLTPMAVIEGSTMANARFFRTEQRLGSVEPGKLADLLLINGDPTKDITHMYNVDRVMLNGQWVEDNR